MIHSFLVYDTAGRIRVSGASDDQGLAELYPDSDVAVLLAEGDCDAHWVDVTQNPVTVETREATSIAVTGTTVTNIPVPAQLILTGPADVEATITESTVELTADFEGLYTLRIEPAHPRWLPFEAEITL